MQCIFFYLCCWIIAAWLEVSAITSFIYKLVMLTHISYHTRLQVCELFLEKRFSSTLNFYVFPLIAQLQSVKFI